VHVQVRQLQPVLPRARVRPPRRPRHHRVLPRGLALQVPQPPLHAVTTPHPPPLYVRRLDPTARDHRDGAVTQQVGAPSARRLCSCIITSGAACLSFSLSFSRRLARARGGMRAWVVQVGRGARDGWWRGGLAYHARAVARRMHGGSWGGRGLGQRDRL
jgi:hypothetical protein